MNLDYTQEEKAFREDLFYRLHVLTLHLLIQERLRLKQRQMGK